MMFSSKAKICAIVANPASHSLSPLLHMSLARQMNLDFVYLAFEVKNDLQVAIKGAYELGIYGMNISLPYKQEVIKYVSELDNSSKIIGAVNTLVRDEKTKSYKAFNTDYKGLNKSLKNNNISIKNQNIIILGFGGAAKAVLYMCLENRVSNINIICRSFEKTYFSISNLLKLYAKLNNFLLYIENNNFVLNCDNFKINISINLFKNLDTHIEFVLDKKDYIVFQSTNVGMHPNSKDLLISNEEFYKKALVGIDLIYTPKTTAFMKKFIKLDKKTINGLDMLIHQGIIAFEYWNETKVPDNIVLNVKNELEEFLKRGNYESFSY